MNPKHTEYVLPESDLILNEGDCPLTMHEHLMVEESARQLYIALSDVRNSCFTENLRLACDAYRKALDLLVVARMFNRLHPASTPESWDGDENGDEKQTPQAP